MRRREKKLVKLRSLLTYGLIIAVVAIWLVWWQWNPVIDRLCRSGSVPSGPSTAVEELLETEAGLEGESPADAERAWTELFDEPPSWPDDLSSPQSCQAVEEQLMKLCRYLDRSGKARGSCALLKQLAEELAARPPHLTSELRQLESVLSNTFHLFRVLRGERMDRVRRLLGEEASLAEPAAMALYRWLISREECARSGRTAIRMEPLYDYAGFLFQTIGGQAYLRRRSPAVEALASFYALVIIDQALNREHNPHGIDPRPEIERTRELIAGRPFVFSERYLEILEEMQRRWERHSM